MSCDNDKIVGFGSTLYWFTIVLCIAVISDFEIYIDPY